MELSMAGTFSLSEPTIDPPVMRGLVALPNGTSASSSSQTFDGLAGVAPRHSWLGCAVWVCVCGLGFRLRPATPGWAVGVCVFVCVPPLYPATSGWGVPWGCVCLGSGVGLCVCWCGRSACTPPLLAGVRAVGVCVWAQVSAVPRHSWLGCWGVCAGVGAPLAPRHSWLGCAPWVCVFGLRFRLRPATPGWVVGVCVRLCVRSACTLPLLAGVCGVGVCGWVQVPAAPRHSWLGCRGLCVLVCSEVKVAMGVPACILLS